MSLPTRPLGRDGPQVTGIGLGLMSFAGWYGQKDTSVDSALKFLDRAYEIGERFWDTADVYTGSEERIGQWFVRSGKRNDIFLASKFGISRGADGKATIRGDREYIKEACTRSLQKLETDTIDLYYSHRPDESVPIEETIQAMAELKDEGKIRYLGLSECDADTLRRAHAVHPISAYQVEYNPLFLGIESPQHKILETCRELGIAIVAYSPVGRGLLAGNITSFDDLPEGDWRRGVEKFSPDNFPTIMALADKIKAIASKHNATPAQICLAWIAAQGEDIIPIPGTSTIKYLEQNTAAIHIKLTDDEVKEIRKYAAETELKGDRYPAGFVKRFDN